MVDIIKQQLNAAALNNSRKQILIDCKKKVEVVIKCLKDLEKIHGKNKDCDKAIKTMQKFLKCNITSPAIYTKYQEVMVLMEKYAQRSRTDSTN